MKLPLLISLPHAGTQVPEELRGYSLLTMDEIIRDGDEEALEIYGWLGESAVAYHTTEIARAFVDMNRAKDDIRLDGVVKTHTIWNQQIYSSPLPEIVIRTLIDRYWRPYHEGLSALANGDAVLGLDCHTMAAVAPPIGPDPGRKRPLVCLGNADGTCPESWIRTLAECFEGSFGMEVRINDPFSGGYIIRAHSGELPWVQLEISRGGSLSSEDKRERVSAALARWLETHGN